MLFSSLTKSRRLHLAFSLTLVLGLVLSLGSVAFAEKGRPGRVTTSDTAFVTINGDPLRILVATDGSSQIYYTGQERGQFYPSSQDLADHGIFLWLGGSVYGPNVAGRWSAYASPDPIPFTEVSQTGPTGDGSAGNPWVVTTVLGAGDIRITQRVSYVNGQQYYRMDSQIQNTGAGQATVTLFHAGDIYLQGSDSGYCLYNANTGGVGGYNEARDWFIVFQPITPASAYRAGHYSRIWMDIGGGNSPGPGFNNTIFDQYIDNGAGLQWSNLSIAAGQSTTISDYTSFTNVEIELPTPTPSVPEAPTPAYTPTPTRTPVPPEIPEPGSLALLATGLLGMGGYLAFRLRNLRP